MIYALVRFFALMHKFAYWDQYSALISLKKIADQITSLIQRIPQSEKLSTVACLNLT